MNEQEMQFADPDWQPRGSSPASQEQGGSIAPLPDLTNRNTPYDAGLNADASSYASYDQGYRGSTQGQISSLSPVVQQMPAQQAGSSPRRRSTWWIWLIVLVVVFLPTIIGSMSHTFSHGPGYNGNPPFYSSQQMQDSFYDLSGVSQLAITDSSGGSILIQVGGSNPNQVEVQTDDGSSPDSSSTGGSLAINTSDNGNVVVTIPESAVLSLSVNAESVEVDGFSGQLSAQTDAGTINLRHDTLSGQSSITSNSGDISLIQDNLAGQVTVQTGEGGSIDFSGTLAPQGNYQFTTDSGDITLNLPADTSMNVQSTPGNGSYQSDFSNPTGNGLKASVTVQTDGGDISIHNSNSQ